MAKKLKLMALEPRVLLDAAGVVTAGETLVNDADQVAQYELSQAEYRDGLQSTESTNGVAPAAPSSDKFKDAEPKSSDVGGNWQLKNTTLGALEQVTENALLVIDTSIENYQSLLADVDPNT